MIRNIQNKEKLILKIETIILVMNLEMKKNQNLIIIVNQKEKKRKYLIKNYCLF